MTISGHKSFQAAYIQYSTGTAWVAFDDALTSVAESGGERQMADTFVSGEDTPLVTSGKRAAKDVTVRYVYSEAGTTGATGMFEILRGVYETAGGGTFYVRYAPRGNVTGYFLFTTNTGTDGTHLSNMTYPSGEIGSAELIMGEFTVHTRNVAKSTVA